MSFLSELRDKKHQLKRTVTIITRPNGSKVSDDGTTQTEIDSIDNYGFVVDTAPDKIPACILDDFLYLGSQDCVDPETIENYKITHVLSVGIPLPDGSFNAIVSKYVPALDLPETVLTEILLTSNRFIGTAKEQNGKVLVHCNAGVSRSASVVIGYLIMDCGFSFDEAYGLVKLRRSCVRPNDGFLKQLKKL
ncbi:hypothetical protein HA402_002020 [Bradysia odoriphaga]|nr:hypothetical protein HA402_002020 [Bradysia odoriphaga]